MEPAALAAGNDALGAQDDAVFLAVKRGEDIGELLLAERLDRLHAPGGENLVGMVVAMVMVMIMAAAGAVLVMLMVMMLVVMLMIVIMAAALAVLVMLVVMMLVIMVMIVIMAAALAVLVVLMMVMLVIVVMMMLMIVAAALAVLVMLVVVMLVIMVMMMLMIVAAAGAMLIMLVVMMRMLMHDGLQHLLGEIVILLHRGEDLRTGELIPRGGDDAGLVVMLAQQRYGRLQLLLAHLLAAGEEDGAGIFDLIEEEFAEVLDIHAALHRIRNGHEAAHDYILKILLHALNSADDVGQLAHAGRLNEDAVRMILIDDLAQRLAEVAHQGAADAAGVHLGDLDAGLLHEAAVNANLAELILDEHDLFAREGFLEQLLDQRGLARAEEAGENINLRHIVNLLLHTNRKRKNSWNTGFQLYIVL